MKKRKKKGTTGCKCLTSTLFGTPETNKNKKQQKSDNKILKPVL